MFGLKNLRSILAGAALALVPLQDALATNNWTTSGTRHELAEPNQIVTSGADTWQDYDRPEDYPNIVRLPIDTIVLDDGIELAAFVTLPADEFGNPIDKEFPTILVISDYNVTLGNLVSEVSPSLGIVLGAADPYLVKRGYATISIDGRGTGNSSGVWDAWGSSQGDYQQIIEWILDQPWTNGDLAVRGISDLGIQALFAAETAHPAIKAVFSIVPAADTYRDTAFTGGAGNLLFISTWLSLTTLASVANPDLILDPASGFPVVANVLANSFLEFQLPIFTQALLGDNALNNDGPFWETRSPIARLDQVQAPTFVVGAVHDIFQRGVPMLYEQLKTQVDSRLMILPGTHFEAILTTVSPNGSFGLPPTNHIELQWYDQYLRGIDARVEDIPQVTQYMVGLDQMATSTDWPVPEAEATRLYFQPFGGLKESKASLFGGDETVYAFPAGGLCSISSAQWSLGILGFIPLECFEDNSFTEKFFNVIYQTSPMDEDFAINGPIQADVYASTTNFAGLVSVRVDDVAPNGTVTPITNGLINMKHRATDDSRSRTLNGETIQPWHTFSESDESVVIPNITAKFPIEIQPTSAVIKKGHRLRVAVGPSNLPQGTIFGAEGLLQLLPTWLTVENNRWYPSSIVLPVVPNDSFTLVPTE